MANVPTGASQFLARFGNQTITCNQYTLTKLGVDKSHCFLKIEDYMILCVPFQFGFKRSMFIASLSKQEMAFFQKYVNEIVGLSIAFMPRGAKTAAPVKFFIRCSLAAIGPMKDRDNVGVFVLDYKTTPDELVTMFGGFLDGQDRIKTQFEDYGKTSIKMTPNTAKLLGYNMYATISEAGAEPKRIQVYNLSSKTIEHLEAAGGNLRIPNSPVSYQLFFKKYRISTGGTVVTSNKLPQGFIQTVSKLSFSPELVEIIDDYWYAARSNPGLRT
ncbi:hypothetical protein AGMMS50293_16160 [Spirochaetia bacterium]|nr:hypothetical protein AGMMS50293_16160 [Spirochaetia bacterium]